MPIRGLGRLRRYYRMARRLVVPGGVILMYHRIARLPMDRHSLVVTPSHFAAHLDYLKTTCHPLSLVELVHALEQGSLPRRAVAITFDDGYVDNYERALPLLEAARIPATIFVASGLIDWDLELWWDELERLILDSPELPNRLQLIVDGHTYDFLTEKPSDREKAYQALYCLIRPLSPSQRNSVLSDILRWSGQTSQGRSGQRVVNSAELRALAASQYIDIGAHTLNHPLLSKLSREEQAQEVSRGRRRTEAVIGRPIVLFAYPYGDFNEVTVDIVRTAGFRVACTVRHGSVEAGDDVLRLRRCAIFDWDIDTFRRKIDSFFVARD